MQDMKEWTWNQLKKEDRTSSIGLQSTMEGAKPFINGIVERIHGIKSHEEAIEVIFNISQKVSHYYFSQQYMMPSQELGRRLDVSLRLLLKDRLKRLREGLK